MTISSFKVSRHAATALLLVFFWLFIQQRIFQMDNRFFQPSFSGVKGLFLYELNDYSGAAQAYRAHFREANAYRSNFQEVYRTERPTEDPAWEAFLQGDLQIARENSEKALEKNPSDIRPLLNLGEIALEEGSEEQALDIFNRILQTQSGQFDALILSSVVYTRKSDYEKAIGMINRALRSNQSELRITTFLKVLEAVGGLEERREKPLCLLAHFYRYLQIYDSSNGRIAADYAAKAIEAGDQPDDAYLTLGVIHSKEGQEEMALHAFLKAMELNPKNTEAYRQAVRIYSERKDLLNEYRMRKAAYEMARGDSFYAVSFGRFLADELGDYTQALAVTEKLLKTSPNDTALLREAGSLYRLMGDPKRSMEYYNRALRLRPQNPSFHEGMGHSMAELGKRKEAIKAYKAALAIGPRRPQPHLGLAKIYSDDRQYKQAIREYEAAERSGKLEASERIRLCTLYNRVSEFKRAADCFKQVLSEDPRNAVAQHLLPYTSKISQ
jgi:tetratricopeptide (TPR) repeat protein